jgi:hypothetical protein
MSRDWEQGSLLESCYAGRSSSFVVSLVVDCNGSHFGVDGGVMAGELGLRGCSLHSADYPCKLRSRNSRSLGGARVRLLVVDCKGSRFGVDGGELEVLFDG